MKMALSKARRNELLSFIFCASLQFSFGFGIISGNDPPASASRTLDSLEKDFVPTFFCDKYEMKDKNACNPAKENCVIEGQDECRGTGRNHCFAAWVNSSENGFKFVGKGCWLNEESCYGKQQCEPRIQSRDVYFCCCEGDYCNRNISFNAVLSLKTDSSTTTELPVVRTGGNSYTKTIVLSIVPILGVAIVVITVFFIWKRHKRYLYMGHRQLPTVDPSYPGTPSEPSINLDKIQLIELRARGRFGSVWKAQLLSDYLAVKIFPQQERQSWLTEQDIYNLPQMSHDNILRFIASEKREENPTIELWLMTEFHENGSLFDYIKGHFLTWQQMCHIAETMARGLAFLHEEIPPTGNLAAKPAIAHRDFKSKNVLLKADLTACIADFGLALKFEPGKGPGETHGQVGTRRYMAPEVLEGAICFNRDAFLRIDMYACALVLWELLSRCCAAEGPFEEYRLPFESAPEIGLHPTLEAMQDYVVTRKMRPPILDQWKLHPGMATMVCTVEECWDQDAEARLSAGCVQERISALLRNFPPGDQSTGGNPPPYMSTSLPLSHSTPPSADSVISFSNSSDIPPKDLSSC